MRTWVSLALLAASATSASAQPAKAQADVLFRQGKDLMAKKQYAEACDSFDASQKLDPSLATALNQADCREKNGQLATAYGLFAEAQRQARGAGDATLEKIAGDRASKLEPRLSKLTIAVAANARVAGLAVTRNGEPVDPVLWGKALPIDGGDQKIAATAPGLPPWSSTITVANEGDAKTVEVPVLAAAAKAPPAGGDGNAAEPVEPEPAPSPAGRSKVPVILAGAGAVVLAIGAVVLEVSARGTNKDSLAETQDMDRRLDLWQQANRKRYIAEGLAVGALACAGVAVWLALRSDPESDRATLTLAPVAGDAMTGLVLDGRF